MLKWIQSKSGNLSLRGLWQYILINGAFFTSELVAVSVIGIGKSVVDTIPKEQAMKEKIMKVKLNIGSYEFIAELAKNSTAQAFTELLQKAPLSLKMKDYGGFEKVSPLGRVLPTKDKPMTTQPGDIMLYQGNHIVLFLKSNHWNYTPIGRINDLTHLKEALAPETITVIYSLED